MSDTPILAAGGNSRLARSLRARLQWRDRRGRWIYMGGGLSFSLRDRNGDIFDANGTFVGADQKNPEFGWVHVRGQEGMKDGFYRVHRRNAEQPQALLDPDYLRSKGIDPEDGVDNSIGERADKDIQNQAEIEVADAPEGWVLDENGAWVTEDQAYKITPSEDSDAVEFENLESGEKEQIASVGDALERAQEEDDKAGDADAEAYDADENEEQRLRDRQRILQRKEDRGKITPEEGDELDDLNERLGTGEETPAEAPEPVEAPEPEVEEPVEEVEEPTEEPVEEVEETTPEPEAADEQYEAPDRDLRDTKDAAWTYVDDYLEDHNFGGDEHKANVDRILALDDESLKAELAEKIGADPDSPVVADLAEQVRDLSSSFRSDFGENDTDVELVDLAELRKAEREENEAQGIRTPGPVHSAKDLAELNRDFASRGTPSRIHESAPDDVVDPPLKMDGSDEQRYKITGVIPPDKLYDDIRNAFENTRILPNGDLLIDSFTRGGADNQILLRRTKKDRFIAYLKSTDNVSGVTTVTKAGVDKHSFRALINDVYSLQSLRYAPVAEWWESRVGREQDPRVVDNDFFEESYFEGVDFSKIFENEDEQAFAQAATAMIVDNFEPGQVMEALGKAYKPSVVRKIMDAVMEQAKHLVQGMQWERQNTHQDRKGEGLQVGDEAVWVDRKTGLAWRGNIVRLVEAQKADPKKDAQGYEYKDVVYFVSPAYNEWRNSLTSEEASALKFNPKAKRRKNQQWTVNSAQLEKITPGAPIPENVWRQKRDESEDQEVVGPLAEGGRLPENPRKARVRKQARDENEDITRDILTRLVDEDPQILADIQVQVKKILDIDPETDLIYGPDGSLQPAPDTEGLPEGMELTVVSIPAEVLDKPVPEAEPAEDGLLRPEDFLSIIDRLLEKPVGKRENRAEVRRTREAAKRARYWRKDPVYGAFEMRMPTPQEVQRNFSRTRPYATVETEARPGDLVKTADGSLLQVVRISPTGASATYRLVKPSKQADLYLPGDLKVGEAFSKRVSRNRMYEIFAPKENIAEDYFRAPLAEAVPEATPEVVGDFDAVTALIADVNIADLPEFFHISRERGVFQKGLRVIQTENGGNLFQKLIDPDEIKNSLADEVISGKIGSLLGIPNTGAVAHNFGDEPEGTSGLVMNQHLEFEGGRQGEITEYASDLSKFPEAPEDLKERIVQMSVLDQLIANRDRHGGNWMAGDDGLPVPIDHGLVDTGWDEWGAKGDTSRLRTFGTFNVYFLAGNDLDFSEPKLAEDPANRILETLYTLRNRMAAQEVREFFLLHAADPKVYDMINSRIFKMIMRLRRGLAFNNLPYPELPQIDELGSELNSDE